MTEPTPCPFCGPTAFSIVVNRKQTRGSSSAHWWTARCGVCRAYGPRAHSAEDAIDKWNRRALDPAQKADERDARRYQAIRLASPGHVLPDRITVDVEVDGKFITVIEEVGEIFCHIVEPLGIQNAIDKALAKEGDNLDRGGG